MWRVAYAGVALVLLWPIRNVPRDFVNSIMSAQACLSAVDLAKLGWEYHGSAGKGFRK